LILTLLSILGFILAPLLVKILAPGFEPEVYQLTVNLCRIMFPYLFFIGLSSTLVSVLNAHGIFFIPALSSAFLNIAMISSLAYAGFKFPDHAIRVEWLSWGVFVGGFLQTIVLFPQLKALGYKVRFHFEKRSEELKLVWQKFIPGVIGISIRQVNLSVDLIIASMLAGGSLTALQMGNRLMQLPLGIFGAAAGTAVLPLFSQLVAEKKKAELEDRIQFSGVSLGMIMLPLFVVFYFCGKDFIRILFLRGQFDETAMQKTFLALVCYAAGLLFASFNRIIVSVFYANKDTKTPVKISAIIVAVNITLNIILVQFFDHAGLALGTTFSALIHYLILVKCGSKQYGLKLHKLHKDWLKILAACLICFSTMFNLSNFFVSNSTIYSIFRSGILTLLIFAIVFCFVTLFRVSYSREVIKKIIRK
jgi:putative peptidoglycan lipid II flippase